MHYINIDDKTKRALIRFGLYVVIGFAAIVITTLLVYALQGYDYDRRQNKIIRNGLVLVESEPAKADIYINGKKDNKRTPNRLPLPVGEYNIALKADGYRKWVHKTTVQPSKISWLHYPTLITKKISRSKVRNISQASELSLSPNGKYLVAITQDNPSMLVVDISSQPYEFSALDLRTLLRKKGKKYGQVEVVEWKDNHVLLQHKSYPEFAVVDVSDTDDSINLNQITKIDWAQFDSTSRLYVIKNRRLRTLDTSSQKLSSSLGKADMVELLDSQIVVGIDKEIFTFDEEISDNRITRADSFKLNKYQGSYYLASKYKDKISVFRDISKSQLVADKVLRLDGEMSWSPSGRFLLVSDGKNNSVYDLEFNTTYDFSLKGEISWLDDFRLSRVFKDRIYILDYDGVNTYGITKSDNISPISSYPYIFYVDSNLKRANLNALK